MPPHPTVARAPVDWRLLWVAYQQKRKPSRGLWDRHTAQASFLNSIIASIDHNTNVSVVVEAFDIFISDVLEALHHLPRQHVIGDGKYESTRLNLLGLNATIAGLQSVAFELDNARALLEYLVLREPRPTSAWAIVAGKLTSLVECIRAAVSYLHKRRDRNPENASHTLNRACPSIRQGVGSPPLLASLNAELFNCTSSICKFPNIRGMSEDITPSQKDGTGKPEGHSIQLGQHCGGHQHQHPLTIKSALLAKEQIRVDKHVHGPGRGLMFEDVLGITAQPNLSPIHNEIHSPEEYDSSGKQFRCHNDTLFLPNFYVACEDQFQDKQVSHHNDDLQERESTNEWAFITDGRPSNLWRVMPDTLQSNTSSPQGVFLASSNVNHVSVAPSSSQGPSSKSVVTEILPVTSIMSVFSTLETSNPPVEPNDIRSSTPCSETESAAFSWAESLSLEVQSISDLQLDDSGDNEGIIDTPAAAVGLHEAPSLWAATSDSELCFNVKFKNTTKENQNSKCSGHDSGKYSDVVSSSAESAFCEPRSNRSEVLNHDQKDDLDLKSVDKHVRESCSLRLRGGRASPPSFFYTSPKDQIVNFNHNTGDSSNMAPKRATKQTSKATVERSEANRIDKNRKKAETRAAKRRASGATSAMGRLFEEIDDPITEASVRMIMNEQNGDYWDREYFLSPNPLPTDWENLDVYWRPQRNVHGKDFVLTVVEDPMKNARAVEDRKRKIRDKNLGPPTDVNWKKDVSTEDPKLDSVVRSNKLTIRKFLNSRGNEYFCDVDEEYLTDRFNLTGLQTEVSHYQHALDLITDVFDLDCDDQTREQIENSARHLYGLVHARYILTTRGLQKMMEKYKAGDFGKCPRVLCESHHLLPMGSSDNYDVKEVQLYCSRCEDLYKPKSSRHAAIDGAYFGSSFHTMFLQVFPHLNPDKSRRRHEPLVFGFKYHANSTLARWQANKREEMTARLRKEGIETGFETEEREEEEMGDSQDEEQDDIDDMFEGPRLAHA